MCNPQDGEKISRAEVDEWYDRVEGSFSCGTEDSHEWTTSEMARVLNEVKRLNRLLEGHDCPSGLVHRAMYEQMVEERDALRADIRAATDILHNVQLCDDGTQYDSQQHLAYVVAGHLKKNGGGR